MSDSFDFTGDEDVVGDDVDCDTETEGVDGCLRTAFRLSRSTRGSRKVSRPFTRSGKKIGGMDSLVFSMESGDDSDDPTSESQDEREDARFVERNVARHDG